MKKYLARDLSQLCTLLLKSVTKYSNPMDYINFTQLGIMHYLLDNQDRDICQKDIEIQMQLKKASITGALDSLESKHAIKRIVDKNDRRKNIIVIDSQALKYKEKIGTYFKDIENKTIKGISEKDLDTFYKVMGKMITNLKEDSSD